MTRDLNEILSELDERNWEAKVVNRLRQARKGDWCAVVDIADYLRNDDLNRYHWVLAKELYQWLVDEGREFYFAYLCDIEHRLDPSLPYTESDVLLLMSYCQQGGQFVFGMVVRALQSDTALFNRFKGQVLQLYKHMTKRRSEDDLALKLWYYVLILDERMNYPQEERETALLDMGCCLKCSTDSYVVTQYLERIVRRNQRYQENWDFRFALVILSRSGEDNLYMFYKGLCALCVGNYSEAFTSFGIGQDMRNRLARAYCLIHGMGTPVDHAAAREILKGYPNDAFALYLLAVSLFRTFDHPKELPPEVIELLEESKRLGYQAAGITLDQMRLICAFYTGDVAKKTSIYNDIKSHASKVSPLSLYAIGCFDIYNICANKVKAYIQLGGRYAGFNIDEYLCSEEINSAKKSMEIEFPAVLPLTAYSRALMRCNVLKESSIDDFIDALYGFNQSPVLRKWAMEKALIDILDEGYCGQTNYVLQLLRNIGMSEKEVLLWDMSIHISERDGVSPLWATLAEGFLDLFDAGANDPLIKLLRAKYCSDRSYEEERAKEFRETLRATANLKDNLLIELRNRLIQGVELEDKIPQIKGQSPINEYNEDLLFHTVGYAFFDYND